MESLLHVSDKTKKCACHFSDKDCMQRITLMSNLPASFDYILDNLNVENMHFTSWR